MISGRVWWIFLRRGSGWLTDRVRRETGLLSHNLHNFPNFGLFNIKSSVGHRSSVRLSGAKREAWSTLLSLCLCLGVLSCEDRMLTASGPERVLRTQEKARSGMPGRQDVCDDAAL